MGRNLGEDCQVTFSVILLLFFLKNIQSKQSVCMPDNYNNTVNWVSPVWCEISWRDLIQSITRGERDHTPALRRRLCSAILTEREKRSRLAVSCSSLSHCAVGAEVQIQTTPPRYRPLCRLSHPELVTAINHETSSITSSSIHRV